MSHFHHALQPGVRLYKWLERLFGPRRRSHRPTRGPMPTPGLYILDAGSF